MAIEAVDPRARGLRTRPATRRYGPLGVVRAARLGAARRDARRRRPTGCGRSAGSRGTTRAEARRAARLLYAAAGGVAARGRALIDPALYRRFWRAHLHRALRGDGRSCSSSAPRRAARSAGSTSASSPSSRPSSGRCCSRSSLAAFLADRAQAGRRACTVPLKTIALAAGPIAARLPAARRRHGARLHRGARRRPLRLGRPLAASGADRRRSALIAPSSRVLWWLPAAGVNVLKPYQTARLTRHELLQPHAVEDRRRRRRPPRPRCRRRDADGARLPAGARDRLRVRLARRAARLPRRDRCSCCSTCSSSGAG